ncbi:MAG: hypothetical protein ACJ74N_12155 [Gaiellaceae bacterium]
MSKMQITITRRMAVTAVAVLALVGAGGAVAASGDSAGTAAKSGTCPGRPGPGVRADFATAVASYLGITKAELKAARDNGTSLAQLATQNGKTVAGLEAAVYADAKAHLDKDVTAGKLPAAQETSMLANLQSHLDDMVNATGPPPHGPPPAA